MGGRGKSKRSGPGEGSIAAVPLSGVLTSLSVIDGPPVKPSLASTEARTGKAAKEVLAARMRMSVVKVRKRKKPMEAGDTAARNRSHRSCRARGPPAA